MLLIAHRGATGLGSQAHPALNAGLAGDLRDAGYGLYAWTVDHPPTARRLQRLGCAAIATNRPGWLRARLPGLVRPVVRPPAVLLVAQGFVGGNAGGGKGRPE